MTDEIATLVLRNNYLQSQAISTLELQTTRRLPELQHLVRTMERSGELNRSVEFLPDDDTFNDRHKLGLGLTRPELAILVSYSKIALNKQLLQSDVPEDPYLSAELERYFPMPMRQRFARAIAQHRLRREIIATATTNSLVNRMGPSFVLRAQEETGSTPGQIARAYSIAREVFDMRRCWKDIEALDNKVPASAQYAMMSETSRLLRHCAYWLLQHRRRDLAVEHAVKEFAPGVRELVVALPEVLAGAYLVGFNDARGAYVKAGVPESLAVRVAALGAANSAFDIVQLARSARCKAVDAARIHYALGTHLGLDWLRNQIEHLAVDGAWQAVARTALRDAAQRIHRQLTTDVLAARLRGDASARVSHWLRSLGDPLTNWQRTLADMRAAGSSDFATLSVGIDSIRRLAD
jgi:glutamate dehydrogenase